MSREDALIWRLVDAIYSGGDAVALCRAFERAVLNLRAAEELQRYEDEQLAYALSILRETDPRATVAA